MSEDARAEADSRQLHVAGFSCQEQDGLWVAVERALDNGFGFVFVTDEAGAIKGVLDLDRMRTAIRKGAHLAFVRAGDLATAWDPSSPHAGATPVLDERNRILDVITHPEARFLAVAEPDLTHREFRNIIDAFLSTWISSTGEYIRAFEQSFSAKIGMAHGVATSNGTVSLHLALTALGIGEGDEVIVPDFTFAASINTVMQTGARPVLIDVDPDTWCVTAELIEKAITPRTRAVMPVHVFGRPAPMTEIAALAKARGLFVIEDCAEAHGARYDGKPVGSFSDVASFSFYANKIITTGEGGICLSNDPELAARMRVLRDHGMRPERRYWHEEPGFNYRMTNLQASIGCAQLERMDELIAMRWQVHSLYEAVLGPVPGIDLPPKMSSRCEPVVWFSCATTAPAKRAQLIAACRDNNVDLRPFFHSLSSMPPYRSFANACPNSLALSMSGVNLPTFRRIDVRLATKISEIFRDVLGR